MARDRPSHYDEGEGCATARSAGDRPPQGLAVARDRPSPYGEGEGYAANRKSVGQDRLILTPFGIRRSRTTETNPAHPAHPAHPASDKKSARRKQIPRAQAMQAQLKTTPTIILPTPAADASTHQTSSTHDSRQKQDPATYASPTAPTYHQTKPPRSDSNTQYPASLTYP